MRGRRTGNEELRTVGVLASIGHRKKAGAVVQAAQILVFKAPAVDRFTSCAIEFCKIATLYHESFDHSMEERVLVVQGRASCACALFTCA